MIKVLKGVNARFRIIKKLLRDQWFGKCGKMYINIASCVNLKMIPEKVPEQNLAEQN